MARNDSKRASAYELGKGNGDYDNSNDTFSWAFVTDAYASIDVNAASLDMGDLTAVASAGNYAANTNLASVTWTQSGDTCTLDAADFNFAADPSNPTTGRCLVIFNNTSGNDDVVNVVDMTTDGTTPVDTTQGFTCTVNAAGLNTVQVNA